MGVVIWGRQYEIRASQEELGISKSMGLQTLVLQRGSESVI